MARSTQELEQLNTVAMAAAVKRNYWRLEVYALRQKLLNAEGQLGEAERLTEELEANAKLASNQLLNPVS